MEDSLKGIFGNQHLEKTSLSIYVNMNNSYTMVYMSVGIFKNLAPSALVYRPLLAYAVS
jgi:hypothetical protein